MSDNHVSSASPASEHSTSPVESAHGEHAHYDMHLKLYCGIGGVLIFLTGVTVALSYHDFGSIRKNIFFGMLLATFKVSLVGAIFMHLKGEKRTIWRFLYFTAFFAAGLFLLTLLSLSDPVFGTSHSHH